MLQVSVTPVHRKREQQCSPICVAQAFALHSDLAVSYAEITIQQFTIAA